MTPQEVYSKLASLGMTVSQAVVVTEKMLADQQAKVAFLDKAISGVSNVAAPLMQAAFIAPPAAGYVLGDLLARGLDAGPDTISDLQQQELINQLRSSADDIRRRRALRQGDDVGDDGKKRRVA